MRNVYYTILVVACLMEHDRRNSLVGVKLNKGSKSIGCVFYNLFN